MPDKVLLWAILGLLLVLCYDKYKNAFASTVSTASTSISADAASSGGVSSDGTYSSMDALNAAYG